MNDVTFSRIVPFGDSGVATPGRSLMSMNALLICRALTRPYQPCATSEAARSTKRTIRSLTRNMYPYNAI